MTEYYKDDRPKWTGPKHRQVARWRGMKLEVTKLNSTVVNGWSEESWLFRVTGGNILSKYSNVVQYEVDAKHCAEGAARDYSTGAKKETA